MNQSQSARGFLTFQFTEVFDCLWCWNIEHFQSQMQYDWKTLFHSALVKLPRKGVKAQAPCQSTGPLLNQHLHILSLRKCFFLQSK